MEDQIEESINASSKYVLTIDDDCIIIEEEIIFDDRLGKTSIHSLKFNHNDQYIAAGTREGTVRIYNVVTKNLTCELDCNLDSSKPVQVQSLKWRPKIEGRTENILMTASKNQVLEWHTPSSKFVT
jgi:WD40 repeat protein